MCEDLYLEARYIYGRPLGQSDGRSKKRSTMCRRWSRRDFVIGFVLLLEQKAEEP